MTLRFRIIVFALTACSARSQSVDVPLQLSTGVPLRLYLTKRLRIRRNEPVQAKVLEPIYAFDRVVIPAGSEVRGRIQAFQQGPWALRVSAMLNGDFTSIAKPLVHFEEVVLPDGSRHPFHSAALVGMNAVISLNKPKTARKPPPPNNGGIIAQAKQQASDQIHSQIDAAKDTIDILRGPERNQWLEELALRKLPYHPRWERKGTRFDAVLLNPLDFGTASVAHAYLETVGSASPPDAVAQARLILEVSSESSKQGDAIEALLEQPVFSADHKLLLPVGTVVTGSVTKTRQATWFHRGGQLRFHFDSVDVGKRWVAEERAPLKAEGQLSAAELPQRTAAKMDREGGIQSSESKVGLLAPVVAGVIAAKSMDNDQRANGTSDGNVSGRTLGGASGFGLVGAAASQASRTVGTALGFYGLAWSVYLHIVAKGQDVRFAKNALIDIHFGTRGTPEPNVPAARPVAGTR